LLAPVRLETKNPPVTKGHDVASRVRDLDVLAAPDVHDVQKKHSVVAQIHHALGIGVLLDPLLVPRARYPLTRSLKSFEDTPSRLFGRLAELDLRVGGAPQGLPPTAVELLVESPCDLHVLLRHRLPPFLGKAFGGSTGLVDVR